MEVCSGGNELWQEVEVFVCDALERRVFGTLEVGICAILQEVLEDFFVVVTDRGAEGSPNAVLITCQCLSHMQLLRDQVPVTYLSNIG